MTWHKLTTGPHTGKTLPEVMLQDPNYVLDGLKAGEFDGAMLAEATEVCRCAARIRVPRADDQEQEVLVAYYLLLNRSFGGFTIVAKSDPRLADFKRFSAAQSQGFDLTMPRRIAPGDERATKVMVEAVLFHYFGNPHAQLTAEECIAFFEDEGNFLKPTAPRSANPQAPTRTGPVVSSLL